MNRFKMLAMAAVVAAAVAALAACGSNSTGTGGGVAPADTSGGGGVDGGGQATGDSTKNKADLSLTPDGAAAEVIKGEKPASKDDATAKTWGATNADAMVNMFITEAGAAGSKVITIFVDSSKNPLPATGIPVGDVDSAAWVTYTVATTALTGTFISKDKGTIDVSPCPAEGKALVGTLKGVVLYDPNPVPLGPKSITLDGTFNLVFFGGGGAVKCKEIPKDVDAGSTGTGDKDAGATAAKSPFAPPAGSTCKTDPCDGGTNTTRMCCPAADCIYSCTYACAGEVEKCTQACNPTDFQCAIGCVGKLVECTDGCPDKCGATADCKTKLAALNKCSQDNEDKCSADGMSEEQEDICYADACCAELTAAF